MLIQLASTVLCVNMHWFSHQAPILNLWEASNGYIYKIYYFGGSYITPTKHLIGDFLFLTFIYLLCFCILSIVPVEKACQPNSLWIQLPLVYLYAIYVYTCLYTCTHLYYISLGKYNYLKVLRKTLMLFVLHFSFFAFKLLPHLS